MSACVLVALVAVAPRVSVASATAANRRTTFVGALTATDSLRVGRDSMIVFRTISAAGATDSLVRRRGGVMMPAGARARVSRANVILLERRLDSVRAIQQR